MPCVDPPGLLPGYHWELPVGILSGGTPGGTPGRSLVATLGGTARQGVALTRPRGLENPRSATEGTDSPWLLYACWRMPPGDRQGLPPKDPGLGFTFGPQSIRGRELPNPRGWAFRKDSRRISLLIPYEDEIRESQLIYSKVPNSRISARCFLDSTTSNQ